MERTVAVTTGEIIIRWEDKTRYYIFLRYEHTDSSESQHSPPGVLDSLFLYRYTGPVKLVKLSYLSDTIMLPS